MTLMLWIGLFFQAAVAHAGGGGGGGGSTFEWKDSPLMDEATRFAEAVASGDYASAYEMGGEVLREKRSLEQFASDMKRWGAGGDGLRGAGRGTGRYPRPPDSNGVGAPCLRKVPVQRKVFHKRESSFPQASPDLIHISD